MNKLNRYTDSTWDPGGALMEKAMNGHYIKV